MVISLAGERLQAVRSCGGGLRMRKKAADISVLMPSRAPFMRRTTGNGGLFRRHRGLAGGRANSRWFDQRTRAAQTTRSGSLFGGGGSRHKSSCWSSRLLLEPVESRLSHSQFRGGPTGEGVSSRTTPRLNRQQDRFDSDAAGPRRLTRSLTGDLRHRPASLVSQATLPANGREL